jgi:hypothetical protein
MGESLAKMELFLFVMAIVQRYKIAMEPGKPPPSLEGITGLSYIPRPYNVCLIERL